MTEVPQATAREAARDALRKLFYDRGVLLPGQVTTSSLPDEVLNLLLSQPLFRAPFIEAQTEEKQT